ncbi:MAG TPA: peptidoglycan DD-metalloendopeptidase family protein [Thermoanaerobaculia bacterium]|nr:peptidoglycan DD-metalloendopeptidase family protein [Thermoanaerobaculia bacterium]
MKRVAALLLLAALPLGAQQSVTPADSERAADLARLQTRIATLKARLSESQKKEATLAEELKRLELKQEIATREGELVAATREDFARRLAEVTRQRGEVSVAAADYRRQLIARARVLQRFGRFGYFRVLLEAKDVPAFLDSIERLDSLARRDGRLLVQYRFAETRLQENLAREQALKAEIDRLYTRSRQEEARVASLKTERERLLASEKSSMASRQREVSALTDKAARLERLLDTLARQSDASEEPVGPSGGIRPWKGVLDWPAKGTIIETFGRHRHPKFDTFTVSNGVSVAVPAGTPVRAVYGGKAVYAQWLAEYGNLVILDHGDGMLTLYAWLQGVSVRPGDPVAAGAEIGQAGFGPGRDESGVYFEVRDRQKAQDPVAWLR